MAKEIERDKNGRYKPGTASPNPGGRPNNKGISLYIMEKTNNLEEVIDIAINALRKDCKTAADRSERWRAVEYLTDRGIGKAIQQQIVELDTPEDAKIKIEFVKVDKVPNENSII